MAPSMKCIALAFFVAATPSFADCTSSGTCTSELASAVQAPALIQRGQSRQNLTLLMDQPDTVSVVYGEEGQDECPAGYTKLITEAECRAAMPFIEDNGKIKDPDGYMGKLKGSAGRDMPKGCYYTPGSDNDDDDYYYAAGVGFNPHHTGAAHSGVKAICQKGFAVETGKVVFVGDSDIDYWHTSPQTVPGSYNLGIGGATCADVVKEIQWILNNFQPAGVVLVCGENDIAGGANVPTTFSRWKKVVDEIRRAGVPLLGIGTKPEAGSKKDHPKHIAYDKKCKNYAKSLSKLMVPAPLTIIDTFSAFLDLGNSDSLYDPDEAPDYLHMSPEGYALWNQWTKKALSGRLDCLIWKGDSCETPAPTAVRLALSACPDGYEEISDEAQCRYAAGLVNQLGVTTEEEAGFPAGCYYCGDNVDDCAQGNWFNTHATGQSLEGSRSYCKRRAQ